MVVNVDRLRGKMVEYGINSDALADKLGIDRTTFYRKMKSGGSKFTVGEVHRMVECIPLSKEEAVDIFFTQ